jgi:hypothetical protein
MFVRNVGCTFGGLHGVISQKIDLLSTIGSYARCIFDSHRLLYGIFYEPRSGRIDSVLNGIV